MPEPGHSPEPEERLPPSLAEDARTATFFSLIEWLTPRPWVTPAIVGVTTAVFAAMLLAGVDPIQPDAEEVLRWGADFGTLSTGPDPWRLLTSIFVHFGVFHLALNMWALWVVGRFVERLVGSFGLFAVYIVSGLSGSLATVWWHPYSASAGASGAVFGLVGVLGGIALRLRHDIPIRVLSRLKNSLAAFLVYNLAFGLALPFINMAAHTAGMVAGFLCGLLIARPLSPDGATRRSRAAVSVLCCGLVVLGGGYAIVPKPADFRACVDALRTTQAEAHLVLEDLQDRLRKGELAPAEAAREIEANVILPWRRSREPLASFRRLPTEWRDYRDTLDRFAEAQEEVWRLFAESLRTGDPATAARALEMQKEANRWSKAMSAD